MNKCECYEEREVIDYSFLNPGRIITGICNGTKETEMCSCKGNREKCDFDPEVRKKAKQLNLEYRDKKELEFYRWWVTEHNLNVEVATAFEKWLKDII